MSSVPDQPPPVARPELIPVWETVIQDFRSRNEEALSGVLDDADKTGAYHVLRDMRERDRVGRDRYGTPLTVNNGRDQLVDAYQEMLDGAAYLRAAWLEGAQVRDVYYRQLDGLMEVRKMLDERELRDELAREVGK